MEGKLLPFSWFNTMKKAQRNFSIFSRWPRENWVCFVGVLCAVVAPWTALTRLSCSFFDLSKLGVCVCVCVCVQTRQSLYHFAVVVVAILYFIHMTIQSDFEFFFFFLKCREQ
jgi:hypothetical protein